MQYISQDNRFLPIFLSMISLKLTKVYCGQELDKKTDTAYKTAVGVILTLVLLGVIGTIYDGFIRERLIRRRCRKISGEDGRRNGKVRLLQRVDLCLVAFSMYSNIQKIFCAFPRPWAKSYDLPVLNGIRYLSFVWLLLGNTYLFGPVYQESAVVSNLLSILTRLPKQLNFQVVINYHLCADSFLLISGILMTKGFLRRFRTNGNKLTVGHVIYHVVHRYWILMPAMMFTLMFYTCLYRYFIDGPLYPSDIGDADNCRTNWWVDLLMIHNIANKEFACLSWLFQIPMLFQLHVFALVILIPLVLKPIIGYAMLFISWAVHIGITAWLTTEFRSGGDGDPLNGDPGRLLREYIIVPWTRAGPFLVGIAYAIILEKTGRRLKINIFVTLVGWLISLATLGAIVFSTYDQFKDGFKPWSVGAHVAYDTLARSAWGIALGWIVLACSTKNGGVIGKFLSWNLFRPLSRLVYTAILTHSLFVFRYVYSDRVLLYVDEYHQGYLVLGHLIFIVIMGLVFGLIWHYPVAIGLENAVLCNSQSKWLQSGRHPEELRAKFEDTDEDKIK